MFSLRSLGRVASAAVLALVLLGAATSAASAATRSVTTTGTDDGNCVASPCATLTYAQQQVQPGDTVQLAVGVYPVGDATFGVDDVTYERSGSGEAKITLPGDSYGIQVSGDGVTFRNLTLSSPDDTIQGDTWGVTYDGTDLTLDRLLVEHLSQGVVVPGNVGGHGITVTSSTFTDINGTAVGIREGLATVIDNDFTAGSSVYVTEQARVMATGNVFRGNPAGDGGTGIYIDTGSAGGTVTGNRFSPILATGIDSGRTIQAADNWWGCNEGIENPGCVENYDLPVENAEPHLVLDVSASPDPFLTTGSSTITASLISSDPQSTFTGGPIGTEVTLSTSEGSLDDTHPALVAGVAQTALHASVAGFPTVTATLDNASATTSVEATEPVEQTITFTSTAPADAAFGGSYTATATGGGSTQPVTFTIDAASTTGACTISGATVSFTGVGTCIVDANQAGDVGFAAADQQQQPFTIAKAPQTITFTSVAPTTATVGGTYDLTATGGASGNPVTFTIDAASTTGACTITGQTVSFTGVGTCIADADQQADANYTAAPQQQQSISVTPVPVTSATLSPSSFAYDAVSAGTGAAPQGKTFTLTNTGNQDITPQDPTLTGNDQADYVIDSVSCDAILHPADQCTYVVTFAPVTIDATYNASAALNVQYAPSATVTSALSGQVNEAPLVLDGPESGQVDVGSSTVATATAPTSIVFTNAGHRVVHPDAVSLMGQDSGSYAITADTCTNAAVAPAGTCSVAVSFTPAAVGVIPATLRVAYDAGSGAVNVGLTGTGLAKQETTGGFAVEHAVDSNGNVVDPGTFPIQGSGTSTSQDIVLKNTGTADVEVGQVSVSGSASRRSVRATRAAGSPAFAISGDRCSGAVVAAGATCVVQVTFAAKTAGTYKANLSIPSSQGTLTVPLAGAVTQAVLPLELGKVRTPVRCLTYGAATPKKSIALKTNAKAKIGWAIKKARDSKALSKCPPAPNGLKHTTKSGTAKGSGVVTTKATGSANVKLSTLLPAKVRKAMKPGLYRITFVARNATGTSPERMVLIRVLKPRR